MTLRLRNIYVSPFIVLLIIYSWYIKKLQELLIVFIVITIHELSHVICAKYYGYNTNDITITPMGLMASININSKTDYKKEITINIIGPCSNLIMACVGYFINSFFLGQSKNMSFFILINISLFILNVLPVLPLDGGKIFKSLLLRSIGYKRTQSVFVFFTKFFIFIIIVLGIYQVYICHNNFSLILIGIFIYLYQNKDFDFQYALLRELIYKKQKLQNSNTFEVFYIVAFKDLKAIDVIKHFLGNKFNIVKVLNNELSVIGELTENEILEGLINKDCNVTIEECLKNRL